MKKLEKILGVVIVVALIMELLLIKGYGLLYILSLTTLSCIYYPLGFAFFNEIRLRRVFKKESYKGLSALRIIGAIAAGCSLSVVCIGVLFRLQRYIGWERNLIIGLVSSFIVLIVALIKYSKSKDVYYTRILKRIFIIGGFGLLLFFTSDPTIVKIQFHKHTDYISAYEDYVNDPHNEELIQKERLEYNRATMSPDNFAIYQKQMLEKKK